MKTKMKRFNREDIKVGMAAVVNELPDTYVYIVDAINGFNVTLSYMAGDQKVGGGTVDYSLLMVPTMEQLANSYNWYRFNITDLDNESEEEEEARKTRTYSGKDIAIVWAKTRYDAKMCFPSYYPNSSDHIADEGKGPHKYGNKVINLVADKEHDDARNEEQAKIRKANKPK